MTLASHAAVDTERPPSYGFSRDFLPAKQQPGTADLSDLADSASGLVTRGRGALWGRVIFRQGAGREAQSTGG